MSEIIILAVKAKHFRNAVFTDHCNCEIAKAANDFFKVRDSSEGKDTLCVNNWRKIFYHKWYGIRKSKANHALASAAGYDDSIIFNLELKEVV